MAGRFMKIKKRVIPFMILVIMAAQLAGCAPKASQEAQTGVTGSPDISLEEEKTDQQNTDISAGQGMGGAQLIKDQDVPELEEISPDELIALFESQYEISKEIYHSDTEETIQTELENIRYTAEFQEKALPSDYEAQYREWRPSVVQQDTQTTETTQQPQNQQSQGQQGQSSKPQGSQTQQQQGDSSGDQGSLEGWEAFGEVITDPSEIYTGIADPYDGYGEISIGYGKDTDSDNTGTQHKYTPGGIKIEEN